METADKLSGELLTRGLHCGVSVLNNVVFCVIGLCSAPIVCPGDDYTACLIYHNWQDTSDRIIEPLIYLA